MAVARPRLGFLGLGWIGKNRMQALQSEGLVDVIAIGDTCQNRLEEIKNEQPDVICCHGLEELLQEELDGVVIATPSAQHAEQAIACFHRGVAVFCQKPLARTEQETQEVVNAAQSADRLLGTDFSYRHVRGVAEMRRMIQVRELGRVFLAELIFHMKTRLLPAGRLERLKCDWAVHGICRLVRTV